MPDETPRVTREIDGHRYEVKLLPALEAIPVWHKVFKVLVGTLDQLGTSGPALIQTLDGMMSGNMSQMGQAALIAKLATRAGAVMLKEMDPAELRFVIDKFSGVTNVIINDGEKEGSPVLSRIFNLHFAGRLSSVAKWLAYCVEVNFGDFLEVGREMWSSMRAASVAPSANAPATDTSPSASPKASTISPGA